MTLKKMDQDGLKLSPEMQKQFQDEIHLITDCLGGSNRQSHSTESMTQSMSSTETMDPRDWIEKPACTKQHPSDAQKLRVPLPRRWFKTLSFSTAGLSTRCSHAYFLKEDLILIYSLSIKNGKLAENPIFRKACSKAKYYAAALSEKFVAVLLKESEDKFLQVFRYDGQRLGTDKFGIEANGHQWEPSSLIAIHEWSNRTWIAVGGRTKQDGTLSGSIKMYCVVEDGGTATLAKHLITFNRPKPNPLAMEFLETLELGPDGDDADAGRLVCVTSNNRVLVWRLAEIPPLGHLLS